MSKREELEIKRDQLDKEVSKDNCLNSITLYERSVLFGKLIRYIGNVLLISSIVAALYTFMFESGEVLLKILLCVFYLLGGFISKVIIEWFSLVLLNLAELNNK